MLPLLTSEEQQVIMHKDPGGSIRGVMTIDVIVRSPCATSQRSSTLNGAVVNISNSCWGSSDVSDLEHHVYES